MSGAGGGGDGQGMGVAHVEGGGEGLGERSVVLLHAGVETDVLEQAQLAVLEPVDCLLCARADAVLGHHDVL